MHSCDIFEFDMRSGTAPPPALIPAATARLQPSQRCRKLSTLHAGGASNAFVDWQRQFSRDAPITYALAASHLMTFVSADAAQGYVVMTYCRARRSAAAAPTDAPFSESSWRTRW